MKLIISGVITFTAGLLSLNTFANNHSELTKDLSLCMELANDNQRLVCFDKLAKLHASPTKTLNSQNDVASQQEILILAEAKKAKEIADFSKEDLKKTGKDKGPDSITATISKLTKLIRGQWVIYLENGQKWQQQDSNTIKLKVGTNIRLKKGTMGAVYLYKEGSHRSIRVERLK